MFLTMLWMRMFLGLELLLRGNGLLESMIVDWSLIIVCHIIEASLMELQLILWRGRHMPTFTRWMRIQMGIMTNLMRIGRLISLVLPRFQWYAIMLLSISILIG